MEQENEQAAASSAGREQRMNQEQNTAANLTKVEIFTDGACKGNPGTGGWGALLVSNGHEKEIFGGETNTTNNRMELRAVIEALGVLNRPCNVVLHTDSE